MSYCYIISYLQVSKCIQQLSWLFLAAATVQVFNGLAVREMAKAVNMILLFEYHDT